MIGTAKRNIIVVPCVVVWPDERILRPGKLRPHQHREDAGEQEVAERRDEIALPDRLVVGGAEPADKAARLRPGPLQEPALLLGRKKDGICAGGGLRRAHRKVLLLVQSSVSR
jgi:hypothetical protein